MGCTIFILGIFLTIFSDMYMTFGACIIVSLMNHIFPTLPNLNASIRRYGRAVFTWIC